MAEAKTTYIMPDSGNSDLTTMALMNGGGFGANMMFNNPFMYFIWMYMMRWMNGNEDNASTQRQLQTLQESLLDNHTSDLIMQAIQGNGNTIREAANRIGCDINGLNFAIQNVSASIGAVESKLGFSAERIINAVNQGDCGVIQALKDCCCETQKSILTLTYENRIAMSDMQARLKDSINYVGLQLEKSSSDNSYQTQAQTCALQNTIRDVNTTNTNAILAKLSEMQNLTLLDKIDALRERNSEQAVVINNAQQTAAFSLMLNSYTAPISIAVNTLQAELAGIKCRLPETVTLPANNNIAVPVQGVPVSLSYGFYGRDNCGCNNTLWG